MSNQIKVNSEGIVTAANNIARNNLETKNEFLEAERAITTLYKFWDGSASNNSRNAFYSIKNTFFEENYNIVENYVSFLRNQVDSGYKQTEKANKSLADAFK